MMMMMMINKLKKKKKLGQIQVLQETIGVEGFISKENVQLTFLGSM